MLTISVLRAKTASMNRPRSAFCTTINSLNCSSPIKGRISSASAYGVAASENRLPPLETATINVANCRRFQQLPNGKPTRSSLCQSMAGNCLLLLLQALCIPAGHVSAQPALRPLPDGIVSHKATCGPPAAFVKHPASAILRHPTPAP